MKNNSFVISSLLLILFLFCLSPPALHFPLLFSPSFLFDILTLRILRSGSERETSSTINFRKQH
jgi:hypothetical protein